MKSTHSSEQRELEDWFCGRMDAKDAASFDAKRANSPALRASYDSLFSFLRALDEDLEVSPLEFESVEARLFSTPTPRALEAEGPTRNARPWAWVAALALVTAAVLVAFYPRVWPQWGSDLGSEAGIDSNKPGRGGIAYVPANPRLGVGQGLVARGGRTGEGLAIELFCDPAKQSASSDAEPPAPGASPIVDGRCPVDRELSFALRLEAFAKRSLGPEAGLVLFGIDARGDLLYYFPTPADPKLPSVTSADWTAIEHSVRLDVNHQAGALRLFALWSDRGASTDEVEALHQILGEHQFQRDSQIGPHDDWTSNLPADLRAKLCPDGLCPSAQVEVQITPAND